MLTRRFRTSFAYHPDDNDDVRSEKFSIFLVASSCCFFALIWSAMYFAVFGPGLTAALPLVFFAIVGSSLYFSHITRNHGYAIYTQIACIIYITAFIQWSIGGIFDSGFVLAWALMGPLIALMYFSVRRSFLWLALFILNVLITTVFDGYFSAHGQAVADSTKVLFFLMNLSISSVVVFALASYFVRNALNEKKKADQLLLNILPEKTARKLKSQVGVIAEEYDSVSVLFADIVNYTGYSSGKKPGEVVAKLNEIFHCFDELASRHGLEKIKTIGDAYMVVGGLPEPSEQHEQAVETLTLEMRTEIKKIGRDDRAPFLLRIGIHSGPVVAGVIGKSKFAYDLWGDTVNVASRLEANGVDGRIHVGADLFGRLKDRFVFEKRGPVEIKGKGRLETYFLVGAA